MGPELVVVLVASVLAALVAAALVVRSERVRRRATDAELARAMRQVEDLGRRLDEVSTEVAMSRQVARPADREYVITTIGELEDTDEEAPERARYLPAPAPAPGRLLEQRLLDTLQRHRGGDAVRRRAVAAAVKVVATSHGVRRALRPEVRDRAAAEAYVARRRSRRARRQELREARRLLRVVRSRAAAPGAAEDAA